MVGLARPAYTDIPGAEPIHFTILESHTNEINSLNNERVAALEEINKIPARPWANNQYYPASS